MGDIKTPRDPSMFQSLHCPFLVDGKTPFWESDHPATEPLTKSLALLLPWDLLLTRILEHYLKAGSGRQEVPQRGQGDAQVFTMQQG